MNSIQILQIAIDAEGGDENAGASRLAEILDCTPQAIYNWKRKGAVPHMAERALKLMYLKQITKAVRAEKEAAKAAMNKRILDPCSESRRAAA